MPYRDSAPAVAPGPIVFIRKDLGEKAGEHIANLSERDLVRVVALGRETVFALVGGASKSGWETCWADGSRRLLDEVENRLSQDADLELVYAEAIRAYLSWARAQVSLHPEDEYWDSPRATLLLARVRADHVRVLHTGPESGVLLGSSAPRRISPHTLQEAVRLVGPTHPSPLQDSLVATRVFGGPHDLPPDEVRWSLSGGETLWFGTGLLSQISVSEIDDEDSLRPYLDERLFYAAARIDVRGRANEAGADAPSGK